MELARRVPPGAAVKLAEYDPDAIAGLEKESAAERLASLGAELAELQELMYGAGQHALLVVLQGLDTSGKDGTIRKVFDHVNPQGCQVTSFKVPTELELRHDFLWRIHTGVPPRGLIGVFNRSHYEDVLVVRVHALVPEAVWRGRYEHINAFERLLVDSGTIVVKFYLHISRDEQRERLLDRERDPEKAWKLSAADWEERRRWDDYIAAYEEALARCSTLHAPWYVVPANRKWFRDVAVTEALVETLRPYRGGWEAKLREIGREQLTAIQALRERK